MSCDVPLKEPSWWHGPADARVVRLLAPLARLYADRATRRLSARQPYRSRLPVLCVGNLTAGGTGKTPLAIYIAERLTEMGETPAILTRGYGGRLKGPHWVDHFKDRARDVGDEPLLLARTAPTLVARDRRAGAIAIETAPQHFSVIIMDDGLQNPALAKDLSFAVIDARRGVGNGQVIPAGPLRAPLDVQLPLVDAVIVNRPPNAGESAPHEGDEWAANRLDVMRREFPGPVLAAHTAPQGDLQWIGQDPLVAFAGIANPDRFFALLEQCGGRIVERQSFKDHHAFSASDVRHLIERAQALGATLVTTDKDHARLTGGRPDMERLAGISRTLSIHLVIEDEQRIEALLAAALSSGGYRSSCSPRT